MTKQRPCRSRVRSRYKRSIQTHFSNRICKSRLRKLLSFLILFVFFLTFVLGLTQVNQIQQVSAWAVFLALLLELLKEMLKEVAKKILDFSMS
jgi:hypothetical protein